MNPDQFRDIANRKVPGTRFTAQQMVDAHEEACERAYVSTRQLQRRLFDYVMDDEWLTVPIHNVYPWGNA